MGATTMTLAQRREYDNEHWCFTWVALTWVKDGEKETLN